MRNFPIPLWSVGFEPIWIRDSVLHPWRSDQAGLTPINLSLHTRGASEDTVTMRGWPSRIKRPDIRSDPDWPPPAITNNAVCAWKCTGQSLAIVSVCPGLRGQPFVQWAEMSTGLKDGWMSTGQSREPGLPTWAGRGCSFKDKLLLYSLISTLVSHLQAIRYF